CSRPSSVLHGRGNLTETNRGSFPVGTVLQYSCDSGYALSGESVITCITPGHWSSAPPHCLRNDGESHTLRSARTFCSRTVG
ncbi:sushi domain-containing protein 6, partial [Tachysurus ichikawai]